MTDNKSKQSSAFRWIILLAIGGAIYGARVYVHYRMNEFTAQDDVDYLEVFTSRGYFTLQQIWDVLVFWEYAVWITIAFFLACKALRFVTRRPLSELFTR